MDASNRISQSLKKRRIGFISFNRPMNLVINKSLRSFCFLISILFGLFPVSSQSLSLNGPWEIIFDDKNAGRTENWMNSQIFEARPNKQNIQVPSAWELYEQDYEGVAFYKRVFDIPESWEGKIVRLHFGAVNYLSEIWLNDEVVGFHEGGFTPFEFRVDEMMKPGESNVLTMRVVGPIILSDKEVDGIKKMETAQWRGGITGGIWQDVSLIATGDTYVNNVFIQPNFSDNSATFHVELDHTSIEATIIDIEVNVSPASHPGQTIASINEEWSLHPGKNTKSWKLEIPNAVHWSPDDPHLYEAKVVVKNDTLISDGWNEQFGMRELTIKNKDFYLNGERIYIKATFFEGLYPNGVAYPDSEEMIRKEIKLAKDAGFNMIRPWRRPPAPIWLDIADELGVLVVGSPALECMTLPLSTPYLPKRVENEVRRSVLRDRNRACIVQWELFNELHRPVLKQLMRPMAMITRDLDPTRLILDESGGWAFGANMYLPNEYEPTKFNDIHNYPGPFIDENRYNGYLSIGLSPEQKEASGYNGPTPGRNVVPGLMTFVSELGYGSLPDLVQNNLLFKKQGNPLTPAFRYHKRLHQEQQNMLKESGFSNLYPDMKKFYLDQQSIHGTANKRMIEAVRANPEVDGYCIHALSAGDWILGAGLIDLWRNPKTYAYEGTKAANQPQIVSIRMKPRNIYAQKGAKLEVIGINEFEDSRSNMIVEIVASNGKIVFSESMQTNWKEGVSQLFTKNLNTKTWRGDYMVHVYMTNDDGRIITKNKFPIDVFGKKDLRKPKGKVALSNASSSLSSFLDRQGIEVVPFNPSIPLSTPVFILNTELENILHQEILEFVKKGGKAIYIEGMQASSTDADLWLPFNAKLHPARGLWTCIPHLVHDHPLFSGLPVNDMMRNEYENIWPTNTLCNLEGNNKTNVQTIVGAIGFDWFSREHKMHYSGPGSSWWGSDVAEISFGEGKIMISQLRLLDNIGKDPVADKVIFNMIRYLKSK